MTDGHSAKSESRRPEGADLDRIIQILSQEYQTLRQEILVRASGRFQFLGLMTTAAALLASGVLGHSIFSGQTLISAILAAVVFAFGLAYFLHLGRQMVDVSARVAQLEERINALVPSESAEHPPIELGNGASVPYRYRVPFFGNYTMSASITVVFSLVGFAQACTAQNHLMCTARSGMVRTVPRTRSRQGGCG